MAAMEFRYLGKSGLKVPALSFGTGTFGGGNEFFDAWGASGAEEGRRLVDLCLEAGVNLFDTADIYSDGLSETILGKAIAGRRDQVLISTKATFRFIAMPGGPNDVGSSRYHLIRACEDSLRRLGTDSIDIYHLHGFDALTPVEQDITPIYPYWHQRQFTERNPAAAPPDKMLMSLCSPGRPRPGSRAKCDPRALCDQSLTPRSQRNAAESAKAFTESFRRPISLG